MSTSNGKPAKQCRYRNKPAVERAGSVYPYCPECGKELAAQGRKAQHRYANAWREVPRHFVERS